MKSNPNSTKRTAWTVYRALDLLSTWTIRACLLILMALWLDTDVAEVSLVLWARLWGEDAAATSYLGLFLVALHQETSTLLGEVEVEWPRRRLATVVTTFLVVSFGAALCLLPVEPVWVSLGLLAWLLLWAALTAPWFLLTRWKPSQKGRASRTRLALLSLSVCGVFGWGYLLSPFFVRGW